MMTSFCVLVAVTTMLLVAVWAEPKKIKDQKKCIIDNLEEIKDKCKDKLPANAQAAIKDCVEGEVKDGLLPKLVKCLNENGITEESNCIKKPKRSPGGLGDNVKDELPAEDLEILKPFADCAKEVHDKQTDCSQGCDPPDQATKRKILKCALPLLPKKGEQTRVAACIHAALNP